MSFVSRQRKVEDFLGEFAGRLVTAQHSAHFAARRTLLLTTPEILRNARGAERVSTAEFFRLRDVIHTDDAVVIFTDSILYSSCSRVG